MKKIYLLRHCEAEKHPILKYTLDNLTDKGIQNAIYLSKYFNHQLAYILSSPHLRALKTAEIIARERRMNVLVNQNWRELSRGIYTERPYEEFLSIWSKEDYNYDFVPPQGESVNQGRKRIIYGMEDILRLEGNILCVTHAGLISNLLMMLYYFTFEEGKPKVGEFCELWFDGSNFILRPELNNFLNLDRVLISSKTKLEKFK